MADEMTETVQTSKSGIDDNHKRSELEKGKDFIEVVGKLFLGYFALCYGVGLITANLYYRRYGVYSLSLFRVNYILAGFWVTLPVIISFGALSILKAAIYSVGWIKKRIDAKTSKKEEEYSIIWVIGFWALFVSSLFMLVVGKYSSKFYNIFITPSLRPIFITICGLVLFRFYRQGAKEIRQVYLLGCSILLLFFSFYYIQQFAENDFENIPQSFGGGQPIVVQLLLEIDEKDEKDKEYFKRAGIEFYGDKNQTGNVNLLFENENEFVLVVKSHESIISKSTLGIKRDMVKSVLYEIRPNSAEHRMGDYRPDPTPTPTPTQTLHSNP